MTLRIYQGDNLEVSEPWAFGSYDLIYVDPPFNTGTTQSLQRISTTSNVAEPDTSRSGFGGRRYKRTTRGSKNAYEDDYGEHYLEWIRPRLEASHRLLKADGSLFVHLDYREVHGVKILLDQVFGGRDHFINEIIWAWDYGGKSKTKWSNKHNNILWYAKDPENYCFNYDAIDRVPYMAPGMQTPERAALGKVPTSCWWATIVPTNGPERTGWPSQKPRSILDRIVKVHSEPGDRLLDLFAGSGSFGEAAVAHGRDCDLVDQNPAAIEIMKKRFCDADNVSWLLATLFSVTSLYFISPVLQRFQ